jgi:hypothetical protein
VRRDSHAHIREALFEQAGKQPEQEQEHAMPHQLSVCLFHADLVLDEFIIENANAVTRQNRQDLAIAFALFYYDLVRRLHHIGIGDANHVRSPCVFRWPG